MLSFSEVSAVLVTRGNMDLTPVLNSLRAFDEILVWDNSDNAMPDWLMAADGPDITLCGGTNAMTYGRVLALTYARNSIIWSQDDDIVHSPANQRAILDAYQPGVLTGCMWPEWSDGARGQGIENGYDDLVFCGSGSVYDRDIPRIAADHYLRHYPHDDFFLLWADTIIGILAPNQQLPIEFDALPEAEADYRMCLLPDAVALKTEAIRRAREVRDRKPSGHDLQIAETAERVAKVAV